MKKFKTYLKEEQGSVSHVVWNSKDKGTATLMVPVDAFDKNQDAATLKTLKIRVPQAKALTKLKKDQNPITHTKGGKTERHYLVRVDFTTSGLKEAKEGPPTAADKVKDKHEREKEDLGRRQEKEKENARETDFRNKENKRKQETAKREAEKRSKERVSENLEDGTDELVTARKKNVPGQ